MRLKDIFSTKASTPISTDSMEGKLMMLTKYGRPRLVQYKSGWYCSLEAAMSAEGTRLEISSSFEHDTPLSALNDCFERMHEAFKAPLPG